MDTNFLSRFRRAVVFSLILCCAALIAADIQITADKLSYSQDQDTAIAEGNTQISYQDIRLTCDKATINQTTKDFTAQGDVEITVINAGTWKAPALKGNLEQKTLNFGPFRLDSEVWHAGGEGGDVSENGNQVIHKGWISTCDCPQPHYSLAASKITCDQKDKTFAAKHVTMRIGKVPIFYLPYVWGTLDTSAGIVIKPGYSGKFGAYLELARVYSHGDDGSSKIYVRGMTKRGIGVGEETRYSSKNRTVDVDIFGIHDNDTAETERGWDRRFKSQDDRYRLHLYWREQITPELSLRLNVDRLSDISMLEDWFRRDHRHWGQPKSFLTLAYDNSWMNAELSLRPRVNTFYTVAEKLPELRIDIPRIRPFGLPVVYSSENSMGYYSMKWRNFDRSRYELMDPWDYDYDFDFDDEINLDDPSDYASFRADTLHTFALPLDLGLLTLTPRASFRATAYSRSSKTPMDQEALADLIDADNPDVLRSLTHVQSYDNEGGRVTRFAAEFGVQAQSKFYSSWSDTQVKWLNLNGIRHVVEPYVNYTFAPEPSEDRDYLYFFDEIDRLERQHFVRLGVDQRWQTRDNANDATPRTFLSLESYCDLHFDRGEETGKYWGDLGNRLSFMPNKNWRLWTSMLYDIGDGNIQRAEAGFRYSRPDSWSFSTRYNYRNDHLSRSVYSMGSELTDFFGESGYIKKHFETADTISATLRLHLNSITSLEIYGEYDFTKNQLSEHHYYLTRKLHCWTLVTGVGWDNSDFEVLVMLRLNAFPNVKLDLNI